jgi:hypothetical protein
MQQIILLDSSHSHQFYEATKRLISTLMEKEKGCATKVAHAMSSINIYMFSC